MDNKIFEEFLESNTSLGQNIELSRKVFVDIIDVLNKHKIQYWCSYGTLLGIVRDNDLIHHDVDIDIALFATDEIKFLSIVPDAEALGFKFIRHQKGMIASFGRDGIYIDFYFFSEKNGVLRCGSTDYRIVKSSLSFTTTNFLNRQVVIPSTPEKFLETWYGSDWRTPKSSVYLNGKKLKDYSARPLTVK